MGLPQELIDRVTNMLQDDRRALEACSLTSKAMFASTRHLLHQTLYLTRGINERILTPAERRRVREGCLELDFRILSFMGERGLLKYTRHLNIHMDFLFSPDALEPHLRHFRSLDRICTLTIHACSAYVWHDVCKTYFMQLYPTLTTLALHFPVDNYRDALRFALQFPSLENLTLEPMQNERRVWSETSASPLVGRPPPLCGRLLCANVAPSDFQRVRELAFGLPGGINFRSVEFRDVDWWCGQQILDGCAGSLEEFTLHIPRNG